MNFYSARSKRFPSCSWPRKKNPIVLGPLGPPSPKSPMPLDEKIIQLFKIKHQYILVHLADSVIRSLKNAFYKLFWFSKRACKSFKITLLKARLKVLLRTARQFCDLENILSINQYVWISYSQIDWFCHPSGHCAMAF